MNYFVAQGNGYPGTNFADSCSGTVYSGPGYNNVNNPANNKLLNSCPPLVSGINPCQQMGKKILLSLGGVYTATPYALTSNQDATDMANFLWKAFGPKQQGYAGPRPFDDGATVNVIDGFDFDIEGIIPGTTTVSFPLSCGVLTGRFSLQANKHIISH
jgi:chitinase